MFRFLVKFVHYKVRVAMENLDARTFENGSQALNAAFQKNTLVTTNAKRKSYGRMTVTGTGGRS